VADGRWEWDETLYAGSVAYYARGRLPYPAEVASALCDALALDGSGRLLDVGCGPGSFTLVVAPLFDQVVGIDADNAMIVAAAEAAVTLASSMSCGGNCGPNTSLRILVGSG
jgi:cyclopropane fatty-acyl-phospholipid synthase-like methyltransferase